MKYSLILTSIFFSSHISFAIDRDPGGPENEPRVEVNISSPQLSTQNISLGQQTQNSGDFESLRKRLYFDPILNINTNRGSLQTGWSLPLPPNLVGMNELKLDYNHQRAENIGLGVGWTWGLPVIKENRDLFSKANFLVSQGLDNSELIQVKEVDAPLYKVTNQILKKHFSNLDSIRLRTFRPVVDNSGSLYFLVEQSSQKVGWIVVTLSGERWVLNSFGNVIAKYDSSYNSIHFDWDGPLLTQVRDSQQQWSVKLSYLKTNPQKMYLYEDEIKYLPDGLSHIQIQNKDQFKKLIVKYQTIENELYLAQSYWENGKIPLWQAHYKKFKNEEVQSPLASLRVDDKKEMIFQQNLAEPVIQETQEGQIYSDLDGDGREDLVDFNLSHLEKEIKRIFESIIKDIDDAYEMEVVKTSQQVQAEFNLLLNKAKISKAYLTNNSSYAQVRDNGLNDSFPEIFPLNIKISPFDAKKINNKIDRDEWEEVQSLINQMKVISTANGMFFVNLGGSGKKSLLYCPGNEGLNREDKDENKEKEKKKNKASNTFLYLANLKNPEIRNKFKFKDIYQHTGSTPRLFIQVVDEANLQKLWNEQGFSSGSEPRSNTLLDVAKWKEIPVSGLSCHQESVFFEPRPGQFAVWSGGQLSLLSSLTQENAKFVTVTGSKLEDFVEVDFLSVQDVESAQISLMPKFGSQKPLTLKKMSQALNITRTGQVVLATNDSTQVFQMAPEQALLTQFISPFGGKIEMKYKVQSGQWVIGQYDRRDSVKNSWKHVFNYKTDLYDSLRNLFVGFALTEETVLSPTSQVENKTIQRQYLKDNVDSVVLFQQRLGRLNGLLVSEKTLGQDETLLRQNNKEELRVHQLSSGRVWPYFRQAATQTLDRKDSQKKITLRQYSYPEDLITDSSGEVLFALNQASRQEGSGLRSQSTDELIDYVKEEKDQLKFIKDHYLVRNQKKIILGKNGQKNIFEANYTLDDLGRTTQSCYGPRCFETSYDSLGRVSSKKDFKGLQTQMTYFGLTPLIQQKNENGIIEVNQYNPLTGELLQTSDNIGSHTVMEYDVDGFMVEKKMLSAAGLVTHFAMDTQWQACQSKKSYCLQNRQLQLREQDLKYDVKLDPFGRVKERLQHHSQGLYSLGLVQYGENQEILSQTLPGFGGNSNYQIYKKRVDALGRDLLVADIDGEVQNEFTHDCSRQFRNQVLVSGSCQNSASQMRRTYIDGETWDFGWNELDHVKSISGLQAVFSHNLFGEQLTSDSQHEEPFWGLDQRTVSDDGKTIQYADGRLIQTNELSQPVLLKNQGPQPSSVEIKYELGRLKETQASFADQVVRAKVDYNPQGLVAAQQSGPFSVRNQYDAYSRLSELSLLAPDLNAQLKINRLDGDVVQILPWLESIERNDSLRRVTQIQFSNGTKLRKSYSGFSNRIESLTYLNRQDEVIFSENYSYNSIHQTTSRVTQSKLKGESSEEFNYDAKTQQMQKPSPAFEVVRELGQVKKIDTTRMNWYGNQLTQIGSVQIYSNAVGEWMAACSQNQCLTKIDSDRYVLGNKTLSILRVDGSPLVFFYNQKQYQILTDKLGSVRGLVDDQGTLLWQRQYSAFGEKSVIYNPNLTAEQKAEALETQKMLIWGYAGLVELPFQLSLKQNVQVYLSQTRAYSPQIGEWLSADDFVKWQPNKLATMPENTHPHRYARNQPLDYVDPSGKAANLIIGAGIGGAIGGVVGWDSNMSTSDNLTSGDFWASVAVGAAGGAMGATGFGGVLGGAFFSGTTELGLQAVNNKGFGALNKEKIIIAGIFGGLASKFGSIISKYVNPGFYKGFNPNVSAEFGEGTVKGMEDIINNSVLSGKILETGAGGFFEGSAGILTDSFTNNVNSDGDAE